MESKEGLALIDKIQKDLERNGLIINTIIEDLKKLRPYAIEEEDPTLTKVIRLTYEHIEENKGFEIPIPEDEPIDEEHEIVAPAEATDVDKLESLKYLLDIMKDAHKKVYRMDLIEYRDALMDF